MATGLLLIGIGRATKLLTFLVGCDKSYTATIRLGQSTITDDAEGDVVTAAGAADLDPGLIQAELQRLTGDIEQVPSSVSAIKVNGVRSYARVRGGEQVELKSRPVRVSRFEVTHRRAHSSGELPVVDLDVEVVVSSGTYVRALARDLGSALGVGGHLLALRRTSVGGYQVSDAAELAALAMLREHDRPLPVAELADAARAQFPVRELTEAEERDLRHGKRIATTIGRSEAVAGIGPAGDLVAMLDESAETTRSIVVFPLSSG